jgi:hypothetical protein
VIEWVPAPSELVTQVALAPASESDAHPAIVAPPSRKVTLPVGVPADPPTVAVKLTFCPAVEGLGVDVMLMPEGFVGVNGGTTNESSHRRSAQLAPPGDPAS